MDIYKKLNLYLEESKIHIKRLLDVLDILEILYPLDNTKMKAVSTRNLY